ncbi:DUF4352 domain-containing protein [Enterococcus sp. LJL120]
MGKRKVTGEDGKQYVMKEKKPFFKKIWFWLLVIVLVIIVGGALGSNSKNETKKVDSGTTTSSSTQESTDVLAETYNVGDTVSYKGYEIRVNSVDFSDGSEYVKPDSGKQFVIVNITINNNTDEKQSYNPFDYSLNADGVSETLMSYLDNVETLNSGELDPGATVTGNLVGEASSAAKLQLRYQASFWNDETVDINLN